MSEGMAQRMLKPDLAKRSGFESSLTAENSGMGTYFGKKGYKTDEFRSKEYTQTKEVKQGTFSGADDRSRMGKETFARRNDTSSLGEDVFKTQSAKLGPQTAHQQGQTFSGRDESFKTSQVRDALKSQSQNKRPLIVEPDPADLAPGKTYSEDEIRKMLNRN